MPKRRKAPTSEQSNARKRKVVEEVVKEVEEEEEEDSGEEEESSSAEESESESEEDEGEDEGEDDDEDEESSSSDEEPNDEASKREALRELLEPFGKSQIIDLLKEAAAKDPKMLPKLIEKADSDPTHRKIFVFGLGWDATSEQLLQVFTPFGEIEESKLITDKNTGRAKGYAFVMFKTRAAAKKALKVPQKRIGSRTVMCQLAATGRPAGMAAAADGGQNRKIYVANVAPHVSPEKLKAFFESFGEIEEGPFGLDPVTNKFKGFAIITYRTNEGFKKALEEPIKVFANSQLHCKKFVENHNKNNASGQSNVSSKNPSSTDVNYGSLGMNTGVLGSDLNASGFLMAQNAMLAAGYNPAGVAASGLSGNYGINSISPSVMANYGSQAALHGLGAFQSTQSALPSAGTLGTPTTATRGPTNAASTTFPSYAYR